MKIEELRIGNLVYINNDKAWKEYSNVPMTVVLINNEITSKEKEVWSKSNGIISVKDKKNYQTINQFSEYIEPIPLTEEWLIKFGFEYFELNKSFQLDVNLGFCVWGRPSAGLNVYVNSEEIGEPVIYLHELQNLYFALTKKELCLDA